MCYNTCSNCGINLSVYTEAEPWGALYCPDCLSEVNAALEQDNELPTDDFYIDQVKPITEFRGEFFYLSNFYNSPITYDGYTFRCVEAAYQASKCDDRYEMAKFTNMDGATAKSNGRKVQLKEGFELEKVNIMRDILRIKFSPNTALARKLIETEPRPIIHENHWRDVTWGVYKGKGSNLLGKLLMDIRTSLL